MFAVNWCSMTGQLLLWTLEKPPLPLSGILYEQGQSQQDQDLKCGNTVKGTSGLVAHRLTTPTYKLQETNQLSKWAKPFSVHTSLCIFVESRTQHSLCLVTELWRDLVESSAQRPLCLVIVAVAQQILAELVEGELSRLVLRRISQTQHMHLC